MSELAPRLLEEYPWPGNVRELQNVIEGAFATARFQLLRVNDIEEILGGAFRQKKPAAGADGGAVEEGFSLGRELDRYERELISQALSRATSISQAARLLGLSRQNLKYKMQKFDL